LLHLTGKLIGMQYFDEIARALQVDRGGAKQFVDFLRVLFDSQDDVFEISESAGQFEVRQQSWKLMEGVGDYSPACTKVLEGLFDGLAAGCGRHIPVHLRPTRDGKPPFIWSIG
jgi:hypothetical protein